MDLADGCTGGEPEDEFVALRRRAENMAGGGNIESSAQTMKEFLTHELQVAEKLLGLQHQETLERFAARRAETGALEERIDQLMVENGKLKEQLEKAQAVALKSALKSNRRAPLSLHDIVRQSKHAKALVESTRRSLSGAMEKSQEGLPQCPPTIKPNPPAMMAPPELTVGGELPGTPLDISDPHLDDTDSECSLIDGPLSHSLGGRSSTFGTGFASRHLGGRFQLAECWDKLAGGGTTRRQRPSDSSRYMLNVDRPSKQDSQKDVDDDPMAPEKMEELRSRHWLGRHVVHPYNPRKGVWDFISLLLVIYDVFYIPLAFFPLGDGLFLQFMKWVTRVFWSIDFPFSFMCGYVTATGSIELRLWPIASRYLRSWFVLDVIVVGVDWLEWFIDSGGGAMSFARFGKASRVLRILRMIRLLRLARMREVLDGIIEKLNSEKLVIIVDITKLMAYMLGTGHIIACLWYWVATWDMNTNWFLVKEEENQGLYKHVDCDEVQAALEKDGEYPCGNVRQLYIMSLRWAITQFAGGMDEVTPVHYYEHCYAGFIFLTSFWSGAVFIGILTSSMTQLYIISSQQQTQLTVLRRYLRQNSISKNLALRVTRNAQYALHERSNATNESAVELIAIVSEPLRVELHFEMYAPTLSIHPFFRRYIDECPHVMRRVCHTAMQMSGIAKGDVIFNVGEIPKTPRMFIISAGEMHYSLSKNGATTRTVLKASSWISEACLWISWTHRGMLTAKEYTRLYSLDAGEFQNMVCSFEHPGFNPMDYALDFLDALNETDVDDVTDLPVPHQLEHCKGIGDDEQVKELQLTRSKARKGTTEKWAKEFSLDRARRITKFVEGIHRNMSRNSGGSMEEEPHLRTASKRSSWDSLNSDRDVSERGGSKEGRSMKDKKDKKDQPHEAEDSSASSSSGIGLTPIAERSKSLQVPLPKPAVKPPPKKSFADLLRKAAQKEENLQPVHTFEQAQDPPMSMPSGFINPSSPAPSTKACSGQAVLGTGPLLGVPQKGVAERAKALRNVSAPYSSGAEDAPRRWISDGNAVARQSPRPEGWAQPSFTAGLVADPGNGLMRFNNQHFRRPATPQGAPWSQTSPFPPGMWASHLIDEEQV